MQASNPNLMSQRGDFFKSSITNSEYRCDPQYNKPLSPASSAKGGNNTHIKQYVSMNIEGRNNHMKSNIKDQ